MNNAAKVQNFDEIKLGNLLFFAFFTYSILKMKDNQTILYQFSYKIC